MKTALLTSCLVIISSLPGPANAAEIKLLTGGAMKSVIQALLPEFQSKSGHTVILQNDTAGKLEARIMGGEAYDVAVITPGRINALIKAGKAAAGINVKIATVGMGVAVKAGAAKPDIATVDAFKSLLLRAKSVAYIDPKAGGSSGIYFDKLIEKLGVASEVRAKAKLKSGGYVAELVAKGEAEIAIHQISEIVPVKDVTLVGPLPAEIQNITTYSGTVSPTAKDKAAAQALLDFLAGPATDGALKSKGMDKPKG